jgi:DNA-binding response OmpR family regulator
MLFLFDLRLKANLSFSNNPILMISTDSKAAECLNAGASYFREKPFEIKNLYQNVSGVAS